MKLFILIAVLALSGCKYMSPGFDREAYQGPLIDEHGQPIQPPTY
jgi:hypothetical protein